jgi:hypothetical protein
MPRYDFFRLSCSKTGDDIITVNVIPPLNTGISKPKETDYSISVFPNPASDKIKIWLKNFEKGDLKIELFNLLGARVFYDNRAASPEIILNTSFFESGIYLLKLSSKKTSQIQKIILQD